MTDLRLEDVDDTKLDEDDLQDVVEEMEDVAVHYGAIGIALRIKPSLVEIIENSHHYDAKKGLREVMKQWLKQNYIIRKVTTEPKWPCWRKVVEVVGKSSAGNNHALAKKIAAKHPLTEREDRRDGVNGTTEHEIAPGQRIPQYNDTKTRGAVAAPHTVQVPHKSNSLPDQPQDSGSGVPAEVPTNPQTAPATDVGTVSNGVETSEPSIPQEASSQDKGEPSSEAVLEYKATKPLQLDQAVEQGGVTISVHEAFPPEYKFSKIRLSSSIVKPELPEVGATIDNTYPLTCFPHGLAVVINNYIFTGHRTRDGALIDCRNVVVTFQYLGYTVREYSNLTATQIVDVFDDISCHDHSHFDSFVCCILSHGRGSCIFGSDSKEVPLKMLAYKLSSDSCRFLTGKPKLLFIDSDRGSNPDDSRANRVHHDSQDCIDGLCLEELSLQESRVVTDASMSALTDFLVGYATSMDGASHRDAKNSSYYIKELCAALCKWSTCKTLEEILGIVYEKVNGEVKDQSPEYVCSLRKKVYFWIEDESPELLPLCKVVEATKEVCVDWYSLAVELGISYRVRKAIERDHSSVEARFRAMMDHWVRRDSPPPSWTALVRALQSPVMAYGHIAREIENMPGVANEVRNKPTTDTPPLLDPLAPLNVDKHLRIVREAAWDVRAQWYFLGVELAVNVGTLKEIEHDMKSCGLCFTALLERWLTQVDPPPRLSDLIAALQSHTLYRTDIAIKVKAITISS